MLIVIPPLPSFKGPVVVDPVLVSVFFLPLLPLVLLMLLLLLVTDFGGRSVTSVFSGVIFVVVSGTTGAAAVAAATGTEVGVAFGVVEPSAIFKDI